MISISFILIILLVSNLYTQQVLETPALLAPENGETITSTTPKLEWYDVEGADCYNVGIYSDKDCTNKVVNSKPYPKKSYWEVTDRYLEKWRRYYWRVAAHNFDGWSKPSAVWSFTVGADLSARQKEWKGKENIAVAEFAGKNVSQADASIVADFVRTEFVNIGQYTVIEKANMDKILAEAAFQATGCTEAECAVQIGKILNVKKMVVGSLSKLEGVYYITASVVEVETGEIETSKTVQCYEVHKLMASTQDLAGQLIGISVSSQKPTIKPAVVGEPAPKKKPKLEGEITEIRENNKIVINLGSKDGVEIGDIFIVTQPILKISPITRKEKIEGYENIGKLEIEYVDRESSLGEISIIKSGKKLKVGNHVLTPEIWIPFNFSFYPSAQLFKEPNVGGLDTGVITKSNKVRGLECGAVNIAKDIRGIQAGAVNITRIGRGIQGGFLTNLTNISYDFRGIQGGLICAVNIARHISGVQFGIINYCETLKGVQIGVINIVKRNYLLPVMVGINVNF
ncbi:MAG: CsgG/HfaB family protein [Elusimicrobiota bacterium]